MILHPNQLIVLLLSKGKVFYGQEPPSEESNTTECGVDYQLLTVMLLKWPNKELPVAVDHRQQRTMASQKVDPIDWLLPPTLHRAVPSELHVFHHVNPSYKSQDLLLQPGANTRTWVCQANALPVRPLRV